VHRRPSLCRSGALLRTQEERKTKTESQKGVRQLIHGNNHSNSSLKFLWEKGNNLLGSPQLLGYQTRMRGYDLPSLLL
jgi:hypothetical protein